MLIEHKVCPYRERQELVRAVGKSLDGYIVKHDKLRVTTDHFVSVGWQVGNRISGEYQLFQVSESAPPSIQGLQVLYVVALHAQVLQIWKRDAEGGDRTDGLERVVRQRDRVDQVALLLRRVKLLLGNGHECREHLARRTVELEEAVLLEEGIFAELREVQQLRLRIVPSAEDFLKDLDGFDRAAALRRSLFHGGIEHVVHHIGRDLDVDSSEPGLVPVEYGLHVRCGDKDDQEFSLLLGLSKNESP